MIVYPSIDIREGRCVRLVHGDFARETVYDDDPASVAGRWAAAGASWVHVVDLDGSLAKEPVSLPIVTRMREIVGPDVRLQLGGGLRTVEHLERAFAVGVDRAVLGSAAINDPAFAIAAIRRWPGRIALGLDARDGMLAANGWVEQTTVRATELGARLRAEGFSTFVFTDIARDGTLTGPNTEALREMATALSEPVDGVEPAHLIASGGVAEVADVERVAATGATGIIIGRALYDGRVDLAEALAAARAVTPGITEARA